MEDNHEETLPVKVVWRNDSFEEDLPSSTTIRGLAEHCADLIEAEPSRIALFITPKPGMLKHPFPATLLSDISTPKTRIKLIGTPTTDVQSLNDMAVRVEARRLARAQARQSARQVKSNPNRDWRKVQEEATYTFHSIRPLNYPHLRNPEKSKRYLERLANDPGIKASMRMHKFSVGLLTEMDPAEHTTHESKTLGLNRNAGEVIELRLRTDAYDGYRDYKVIRKTLCHELAHNVHSKHDRKFYDLMQAIEKEVARNDTLHGGHSVGGGEFYDAGDGYVEDEDHVDGGGWTGGEFVLGSTGVGYSAASQGLSRRDILANAVEARLRKQKQLEDEEASSKDNEKA